MPNGAQLAVEDSTTKNPTTKKLTGEKAKAIPWPMLREHSPDTEYEAKLADIDAKFAD